MNYKIVEGKDWVYGVWWTCVGDKVWIHHYLLFKEGVREDVQM